MSKQSLCLQQNIQQLLAEYGTDQCVFATFTHKNKVYKAVESSAMFNSLNTNILSKKFINGVTVVELHKDNSIHYHSVLVLGEKFGFGSCGSYEHQIKIIDLAQKAYRDGQFVRSKQLFSKVDPVLRDLWKYFRDKAESYGFGRCQFVPVKNAYAIGGYVSKYLNKQMATWVDGKRPKNLKGVRLVRYMGMWGRSKSVKIKYVRDNDTDGQYVVGGVVGCYERNNKVKVVDGQEIKSVYGWRNCRAQFSFIKSVFRQVLCALAVDNKDLTYTKLIKFIINRVGGTKINKWGWYFKKYIDSIIKDLDLEVIDVYAVMTICAIVKDDFLHYS